MRTILAPSLAALFLVAGCGSSAATSTGDPGSSGLAAPPEGKGLQLGFEAKVAAGQEVHVCKEIALPAGAQIDVERLEHLYSAGTHHFIAYRTGATAATAHEGTFDCGDIPGPLVYSSQVASEASSYPQGVGVRFTGGEVLRLELHYLNTTTADATAKVAMNLWFAEQPLEKEAGSFFMYDRDIAVPAHGKFTARMHCEIPDDIDIAFILPHVHIHGTGERIWIRGPGAPADPIVTSAGYEDLHTRYFATPVAIKAGQSLDFECDYVNTGDEPVVEGPSKTQNEMCMILGSYYPRMDKAAEWCTVEGSGPVHDGAKTCGESLACLQAGDTTFDNEQCTVDVCKADSQLFNDVGNCAFNNCTSVCPGPQCGDCALKHCLSEIGACNAGKCE